MEARYEMLIEKAVALEKIGRYMEAARILDEMISSGFIDKSVIVMRISVYFKMGLISEALDFIRKFESKIDEGEIRSWKIFLLSELGEAQSFVKELSNYRNGANGIPEKRFEIPEADSFFKAVSLAIVRFPEWYWTSDGLNFNILSRSINSGDLLGGWIDTLYTDFFDSLNVRVPHIDHYLRAMFFYAAGRIGDSLIEISYDSSHPVYREYIKGVFLKFLRRVEALDDDYSKAAGYHILRMKEESLDSISKALKYDKNEIYEYSKKIINATSNSITSSASRKILEE